MSEEEDGKRMLFGVFLVEVVLVAVHIYLGVLDLV